MPVLNDVIKSETKRIGLIGGCINNQPGMPPKNLYHKVLRNLLEAEPGPDNFEVSLATYLTYDKVFEKTRDFIVNKNLDHIYIFIRNFPLMPLAKPFIRYERDAGKINWALHPNILKREMKWDPVMSNFQGINPFVFKPQRKFGWRDLNLLAGQLIGLNKWALKYIRSQFQKINNYCEAHHVRITIIAPQKSPTSIMGDAMCKWVTYDLEKFCKENHVGFINIFEYGLNYFEADHIHLNAEAHTLLGQTIYKDLKKSLQTQQYSLIS